MRHETRYVNELTSCLDKFKAARVHDFRWRRLSDEEHGLFDVAAEGEDQVVALLSGSGFRIWDQKPLATASYQPEVSQKVRQALDSFSQRSLRDISTAMNGMLT